MVQGLVNISIKLLLLFIVSDDNANKCHGVRLSLGGKAGIGLGVFIFAACIWTRGRQWKRRRRSSVPAPSRQPARPAPVSAPEPLIEPSPQGAAAVIQIGGRLISNLIICCRRSSDLIFKV